MRENKEKKKKKKGCRRRRNLCEQGGWKTTKGKQIDLAIKFLSLL